MITRCPDCHAWFRIRAEHLSIANGFVTCGDCDAVFNALPTLIEETESIVQRLGVPAEPQAPITTEPVPRDQSESPEDGPSDESSVPAPQPDTDSEIAQSEPSPETEQSDSAEAKAPVPPSSVDDHAILFTEPGATYDLDDTASENAELEVDALAILQSDLDPLSKLPLRRGASHVIWRVLLAVLGLAVAAQTAWIYREELTERFPPSAVAVAFMCGYIDCVTGAEPEADVIRLLARDVRDHPQYEQALLVNATMVNGAPSAQPYPTIDLTLRDAVGNIMGARQFQPQEYLDESISIENGMPSERPIYVVMELGGGAAAAISFEFSFL